MNRSRLFGWALFGSVGLNFFLVASIAKHRFHPPPSPERREHLACPQMGERADHRSTPKKDGTWNFPRDERRGKRGGGAGRPGSDDETNLSLHRHLVMVMGGPRDPRVRALFSDNREARKESRAQMMAARQAVTAAIAALPFQEERLQTALDQLESEADKARERATENLLKLSSQLTDEERKELQRLEFVDPPRRQKQGSKRPHGL